MPQIGGYVGQILQLALAGYQIDLADKVTRAGLLSLLVGWEAVFVLNAVLGLAWMFLWFYVVYDCPSHHPRCSAKERMFIERALAHEAGQIERTTTAAGMHVAGNDCTTMEEPIEHTEWSCALYRRMARSKPVLAICAASFCHNTGNCEWQSLEQSFVTI